MKIVYLCHAGQETGYGRAATDLALALLGAGVDLEVVPINQRLSHFVEGRAAALAPHVRSIGDCEHADAVIVHTMPLDCREVRARYDEGGDAGQCPWIAYTTWEGVGVPENVRLSLLGTIGGGEHGDHFFGDVWVPSTATQDAFLNSDDAPVGVFVLPHAFDVKEREGYQRYMTETGRHAGKHDGFRFQYVGAWTTRKNPHGLIRAFASTFTPADDVELVIHSPRVSLEMFTAALVATGLEQSEAPKIRLTSDRWSHEAMRTLPSIYDCFVTATRGESWNLPAFEAMLAGRMVIAPGGMGHDDFLFDDPNDPLKMGFEPDLTNAKRVASIQQPAFVDVEMFTPQVPLAWSLDGMQQNGFVFKTTGAQGLTSRTLWRDPDLVSLGYQMRQVYERRERDITLHYQPEERFGYEAVAKRAIGRIEWLLNGREKTT